MKQNAKNPPKLTVHQIISHMKNDLGIKFEYIDEAEAASFLQNNNYVSSQASSFNKR